MQKRCPYDHSVEKAFLDLVCCGINDKLPDRGLFSSLNVSDWEEIYRMARRQTVCGICYDAFCRLPGELLPPENILTRWVARVNAIEITNRRMAQALSSLLGIFRNEGLRPVVQKGMSVARFYSIPELRECGDIDLWFPTEDIDRAIKVAAENGSGLRHNPDSSVSFIYDGFVIEIHRRLISLSYPAGLRRIDTLIRELGTDRNNSEELPSPPALLELLLVTVHIMRHAFGKGIGLRQICDYYRAAVALAGKYDAGLFAEVCRTTGISRWVALLNDFVGKYFGIPSSGLPPSGLDSKSVKSPDALMEIIRDGGNFGQYINESVQGESVVGKGKLHTFKMFVGHARFAVSIAPKEALWSIGRLILGQFSR